MKCMPHFPGADLCPLLPSIQISDSTFYTVSPLLLWLRSALFWSHRPPSLASSPPSAAVSYSKWQCCFMGNLAGEHQHSRRKINLVGGYTYFLLLVSSCARYFSNPLSRTRSPNSWRNSSKAGPADSLLYISSSVLCPALQYMMPTFCW